MIEFNFKNYIIRSKPNKLHESEGFPYTPNGVIIHNHGNHSDEFQPKIPSTKLKCKSIEEAHSVYIEYALKFLTSSSK